MRARARRRDRPAHAPARHLPPGFPEIERGVGRRLGGRHRVEKVLGRDGLLGRRLVGHVWGLEAFEGRLRGGGELAQRVFGPGTPRVGGERNLLGRRRVVRGEIERQIGRRRLRRLFQDRILELGWLEGRGLRLRRRWRWRHGGLGLGRLGLRSAPPDRRPSAQGALPGGAVGLRQGRLEVRWREGRRVRSRRRWRRRWLGHRPDARRGRTRRLLVGPLPAGARGRGDVARLPARDRDQRSWRAG